MSNRRSAITTVLTCWCLALSFASVDGQSNGTRPARVERRAPSLVNVDTPLSVLLQSADAVIAVRVLKPLGTRLLAEPFPAPFTEYEVTPTEVLKRHPAMVFGSILPIATRERPGQFNSLTLDDVAKAPPLIHGREYLLLLTFSPALERLLFDSDQVFDITGTNVVASERVRATPHGRELAGLPTAEALRSVRILLESP
ncbi:MAG TPA: hypothetical protein VFO21_11555 [Vicinamibacterales bacterium]|nr:hypothetical protein [Vicinamibacterales bacterium]